jgi:hypothetical protein
MDRIALMANAAEAPRCVDWLIAASLLKRASRHERGRLGACGHGPCPAVKDAQGLLAEQVGRLRFCLPSLAFRASRKLCAADDLKVDVDGLLEERLRGA